MITAQIAALGMYDRAETAAANDALWALIRDHLRAGGIAAPEALTRGDLAYLAGWQSPNLIFSQTCGLPYRSLLHGKVTLVASPDYRLPHCPAGYYNSVYVVRADDPRQTLADFAGSRFAVNEAISHSGWGGPWLDHAARGLTLRPTLMTGAHRQSGLAVANGAADYAALDALSFKFMQRHDGYASDLRIIDYTPSTPATPYIAAAHLDADRVFAALDAAMAALPQQTRDLLSLHGVTRISAANYMAVPIPPAPQITI